MALLLEANGPWRIGFPNAVSPCSFLLLVNGDLLFPSQLLAWRPLLRRYFLHQDQRCQGEETNGGEGNCAGLWH